MQNSKASIRWGLKQREPAARFYGGRGGAGWEVMRRKADIVRHWLRLGVALGGL